MCSFCYTEGALRVSAAATAGLMAKFVARRKNVAAALCKLPPDDLFPEIMQS
jgi:hypothetical protein